MKKSAVSMMILFIPLFALAQSCYFNHPIDLEQIKQLKKKGCMNVSVVEKRTYPDALMAAINGKWTSLQLAMPKGDYEIIKRLIDAGADANANVDNNTPLNVFVSVK